MPFEPDEWLEPLPDAKDEAKKGGRAAEEIARFSVDVRPPPSAPCCTNRQRGRAAGGALGAGRPPRRVGPPCRRA